MFYKRTLKTFLFPAVNILLGIFLLGAFFTASLNVVETIPVAQMSALRYLTPQPIDYLWKFNYDQAPLDINMFRSYRDYFKYMIKVFPSLRDAYGMLGYCYHYLGDDVTAIDYFKKAIIYNPNYSWDYYDLAIIYFNESRYNEGFDLLTRMQRVDPQNSLRIMFTSQSVDLPIIGSTSKEVLKASTQHLQSSYAISSFLLNGLDHATSRDSIEKIITDMKLKVYAF